MKRYSVQPRDRIFVKGHGFLFLAKYMSRNIGKNISETLSSKCSKKLLDQAKKNAPDALETVPENSRRNW